MNQTSDNKKNFSDFSLEAVSLSEEEREEVSAEINRLLMSSKMEVDNVRLSPKAKNSGIFVPLLIISGLLAFCGVFAGATYLLFSRGKEVQIERSQTFYSTESQLIREILYQSNSRIREKEEEISSIQERLQTIANGLRFLNNNIQTTVDDRRKELEEQFRVQLEEREKEFLAQQYTREEVEELLKEERRKANQAIEVELASLREAVAFQENQRESDLLRVKSELESALKIKQDEITTLTIQIDEQTQLLEKKQSAALLSDLQQQQQRRAALDEQVSGALITTMDEISIGLSSTEIGQLLTLLQSEEVTRLLGSGRVNASIRVLELLESYQLLKDQLQRRQEEAVTLAALPVVLTGGEERIQQLQESYLSQVEGVEKVEDITDIKELKKRKDGLLAPFLFADDVFPGLRELFLGVNDRIEELSQLQNQSQWKRSSETTRIQILSDVEIIVGAALGNLRLQNPAQRLIQNDRKLAEIYSLIREGGRLNPTPFSISDNAEVFGYVTALLSRGSFTVNKVSQASVSLGDAVEVHRGEGRSNQNLIATGIIIRVDGSTIQCQINNQRDESIEIRPNDTVFLVNNS